MTSLITIFGLPKPFQNDSKLRQENAIKSWTCMADTDVLLFGDEPGIFEAAQVHGAGHVPEIERTSWGTPLLSDAFQKAAELSDSPYLCYANCDIIFLDDFIEAVRVIDIPLFLAVGQRWNIDIDYKVHLEDPLVRSELQFKARASRDMEPPWGSDFFVWPREINWRMPSFAVGRPPWDNWLIHEARTRRIPVIDITPSVSVIHQNHGYSHVPNRSGQAWSGPETEANLDLVRADELMDLTHVTHLLAGGHLKRARGWRYIRARILRLPLTYPGIARPLAPARRAFRSVRRVLGLKGDEGSTKSYR